ncbi:hypothetical protein OC835_002319 [Tilletia horrida]|nr:hypothetical protein OC835_002319 [Tilletia horrida]
MAASALRSSSASSSAHVAEGSAHAPDLGHAQAAARLEREREEERRHFESVLKAFDSYLPMMLAANETRKRSYKSLPPHHRTLLEDLGPALPAPLLTEDHSINSGSSSTNPILTGKGVRSRLEEIDDRIRRNADVLSKIVADSRQFMQAAGQYMAGDPPSSAAAAAAAAAVGEGDSERSSSSSPSSDEADGAAGDGKQSGAAGRSGPVEVAIPPLGIPADGPSATLAAASVATGAPATPGSTPASEIGTGTGTAAERRERRKKLAAEREQKQREAEQSAHHLEKVRSTIKQFVRDWSEDGRAEREAAYQPIIDAVNARFGHIRAGQKATLHILVPGAGLGRLAWEFAQRGYSCQGNEFSFYMLVASHFVLNETRAVHEHVLYPYVHSASNWRTAADMLQPVLVPDVLPSSLPDGVDFSMVAGEFVEVYGRPAERERWQCVATSFFIDTARNIVQYLEVIHSVLELGGYWINAGPLLWHFENGPGEMSIELTLDETMALVRRMGFEVEEERMLPPQMYTGAARGMLTYQYLPYFWVARKVRRAPMQ